MNNTEKASGKLRRGFPLPCNPGAKSAKISPNMAQSPVLPEVFNSPTHGQLSWRETLVKMLAFMGADPKASYEVIIGTDSEASAGQADFVSAVIVHKKGRGGGYFWGRGKLIKLFSI